MSYTPSLYGGRRRKRVTHRKIGRGVLSTLLGSFGLGKRKVHRRRRVGAARPRRKTGRGILSTLLGTFGLGKRKRKVHRRKHHGGLMGPFVGGHMIAGAARKHRRRRVHRGAGFWGDAWDVIKNVGKKLGNAGLDLGVKAATNYASKRLGLGRRRRVRRGGASTYGGAHHHHGRALSSMFAGAGRRHSAVMHHHRLLR